MRALHDLRTVELDGIDPPPASGPGKSRKALAKIAQGYQGPKVRPCCGTCSRLVATDRNPENVKDDPKLTCALGGFIVQRGAGCGEFRRR